MNATAASRITPVPPLYERLGGPAGISRIVDDLVAAHLANPLVRTRFEGVDRERLKQRAREFLAAGSGGPAAYSGRDMRAAHKGMNISEQEFLAVVDDAMLALDKNRVDADTKKDVLAILYSLKTEIIRA